MTMPQGANRKVTPMRTPMRSILGMVFGILLLAGCSTPESTAVANGGPVCEKGQQFAPQTSSTVAVSTPTVKDGLAVLAILQKHGPLPVHYGEPIKVAVDAGTVEKFVSNDDVLVYFPTQKNMPKTVAWVDPRSKCIGNSQVLPSTEVLGWHHFKMKQWGIAALPRHLIHKDALCVRAWTFEVVHVPELTQGAFTGKKGVICSYPGQIAASLSRGHGTYFTLVAATK